MSIERYFPCERESAVDSFEYKIKKIYECLGDDISKGIFMYRLMYSLTKDYRYMEKLICSTNSGKKFKEILTEKSQYPIYIYGAGIKGIRLKYLFPEQNFVAYIDKYKTGTYGGLPVYGLDYLSQLNGKYTILISVTMKPEEIRNALGFWGGAEDNILVLREFDFEAGKAKYFDSNILSPNTKKAFVDVGCFDGEDTVRYLTWCRNEGAPVIAIEADAENYSICKDKLSRYKNTVVYNCGLSDKEDVLKFDMTSTSSSKISEMGNTQIHVKPLDLLAGDQEIGYIKMDIEGAEEAALLGAKNTISQQRPNIAISIYHKLEDIWNLPLLLLDMNPCYKFYLRHYTVGITDTVLYAVNES